MVSPITNLVFTETIKPLFMVIWRKSISLLFRTYGACTFFLLCTNTVSFVINDKSYIIPLEKICHFFCDTLMTLYLISQILFFPYLLSNILKAIFPGKRLKYKTKRTCSVKHTVNLTADTFYVVTTEKINIYPLWLRQKTTDSQTCCANVQLSQKLVFPHDP